MMYVLQLYALFPHLQVTFSNCMSYISFLSNLKAIFNNYIMERTFKKGVQI